MTSMHLRAGICAASLLLVSLVACTSSTPTGPAGGAVTGPQDSHCGSTKQVTTKAACQPSADAGVPDSGMPPMDSGMPADDGGASEYGKPMYNQSGSDDECKYDVSWTSTPVYKDTDVTFTVTVKTRVDGAASVGAETDTEVFLDDTHPAPNAGTKTTDKGGGVYSIGPIRFDKSGRWTVRFHFFDACVDGEESPHGHAAFYVDVP